MQPSGNLFGAILRFDVSTLPGTFKDVFASTEGATDCSKFLHRPEVSHTFARPQAWPAQLCVSIHVLSLCMSGTLWHGR